MAVFYSLPKIHKPGFPPPFRPIVADIGSLNEGLCSWVDRFLQLLVRCIPGYLQDSRDVLKAFQDFTWDNNMSWVTADVTSLYTVIPHDLALIAIDWFLNVYGGYSVELRDFIILSVEYLLKHNFLIFDRQFYLQSTRASMGAKFSPSLANIYMTWWEGKYCSLFQTHIFHLFFGFPDT